MNECGGDGVNVDVDWGGECDIGCRWGRVTAFVGGGVV